MCFADMLPLLECSALGTFLSKPLVLFRAFPRFLNRRRHVSEQEVSFVAVAFA